MKKYLQLAALIAKYGTLQSSTQNFNENRAKSLESLQEFIPPDSRFQLNATHAPKNSRNNLVAQAAFIKSSFEDKGGHLSSQNLAYIRIPKAANTSISYAMLVKKYPALKEKNPDETQVNFLTDVHLQTAKPDVQKFFTVVRNPFARLVSVYRDFFESKHGQFLYADYLFGVLSRNLSFAEFVNRICQIPDSLKDQHFRPQHCFIKPYENKGIPVTCFRLEEPDVLEKFLIKYGMELVHLNKSTDYTYTQYYNSHRVNQVYDIYRVDIEKFGYRQTYESLIAKVKPEKGTGNSF